jgi:hypothetical protein
LKWDADYDGDNANIMLTSTTDGKKKQIGIQLDNNDLANLLNIPSVNMPLHRRLNDDFIKRPTPKLVQIQLPEEDTDLTNIESSEMEPSSTSIEDLLGSKNYLSSPLPNDKLIIPITINDRASHDYTLTSRRRHIRPKTHKTYRVYKVNKKPLRSSRSSSRHRSYRSSRSSRKSSRKSIF